MSAHVAFLGLGRMGVRMAANVAAAGQRLVVWNRSPGRAADLVALGAVEAATPAEAATGAAVVVSMLADDEAVREVYLGEHGVAGRDRDAGGPGADGCVAVDMSTVGPATTAAVHAGLAAVGVPLVDAPVSGSIEFAETAQLVTMVGGDPAAVARARPVLAAMTRRQYLVGGPGTGHALKLAVNSVIGATNQAVAEALVLAERSGIAREAAYEVFVDSAIASPFVRYKRDSFVDPDSAPQGFTCRLLQKDLDLIQALARRVGAPMPQLATANEVLTMAIGAGWGDADLNRVADLLRLLAGDPAAALPPRTPDPKDR